MAKNKKIKNALIPFFGNEHPEKAGEKTLERVKKGGKIYLLHIVDEAQTRRIRYTTGQLGEESEIVKTIKESQEKIQEMAADDYTEKMKNDAAKKGISIKSIYVSGDPAQEVLNAIDKYSIELVVVEKLREKIDEIILGDELDFLKENAPCEVEIIS